MRPYEPARSGSSPAASTSTAPRCSTRWPTKSRDDRRDALDASDDVPVRGGRQAGADRDRRDPPGAARRRRGRRVRRRDRLDAHLQPGEDVDHRARPAPQAAAAPAHAGQPGAAVGRDRHGLHEPQPGRPRRPGVRGPSRPGSASPARPSPGTSATPRSLAGVGVWARAAARPRRAVDDAAGPLRRQHAQRRGHRGRQGRGRAPLRRLGQHLGRQRPGRRRGRGRRRRHRRARSPSTPTPTTCVPSCCPTATGTSRCATAPASSSACATFLDRRRLHGVHHQLRGPRRAAPAARAWPCSG